MHAKAEHLIFVDSDDYSSYSEEYEELADASAELEEEESEDEE